MSMQLSSSAFTHNGNMPSRYTCDESDISPPLNWSGVPPQAMQNHVLTQATLIGTYQRAGK